MPFDIGHSINNLTDWLTKDSIIANLLNNPLGAALLIVLTIFIIFYFSNNDFYEDKKIIMRAFTYCYIATVGLLFLHYSGVKDSLLKVGQGKSTQAMLNKIDSQQSEFDISQMTQSSPLMTPTPDLVQIPPGVTI